MSSNPGRYSDDTLQKLLSKASVDEIESLLKVYRGDNSYLVAPQVLDLPFKLFGSGYFKSLVLVAEKLDLHVTEEKKEGEGDFYYDSKPFDSYENIKVQKATVKIEKKILNKVLEITYERLSETDKKKFNKSIQDVTSNHGKSASGLVGTAGLMAVANLGGFSTYMLMSSVLSTISFGTLGFGAYTAASSILSTLIGPVGWIGLGIYALFKFGGPDYEKLIPAVATVALIRQRVLYEEEQARKAEEARRAELRRAELARRAEIRRTADIPNRDSVYKGFLSVFLILTIFAAFSVIIAVSA